MGAEFSIEEPGTLANAKAVLFVDDCYGEVFELHGFLDQSLSPDDQLEGPAGDAGQKFAALRGWQAAEEQAALDAAVFQEFFEGLPVLSREDFCGGHQHGLLTGCDRGQHRINGDGRLSGADIGLQQAVHGLLQFQVTDDILHSGVLAVGHAKIEQSADTRIDASGDINGDGFQALCHPSAQSQAQLKFEEVIQQDASAGVFPLLPALGNMQAAQGGGKFRKLVSRAEVEW
jgi:hypothetical protein